MAVICSTSVEAFFHEVLVDSLGRRGITAAEHTEHYLVGLLGAYASSRLPDRPLALVLAESQGDDAERVRALKEVGDTSLYLVGFFAKSIKNRLVQADYYVNLGAAAYGELAARMHGSSVRDVYDELSAKFPRFVDVLADIRAQVNFANADVVALYEEWLHTRSDWVEGRLRSMGVLVSESEDDTLQ